MRNLAMWCGALVAGGALGLGLRLVFFLIAAFVLRTAGDIGADVARWTPWIDPVYSRTAIHTATDVRIRGLVMAGSPGEALHTLAPDVFLDPSRARTPVI